MISHRPTISLFSLSFPVSFPSRENSLFLVYHHIKLKITNYLVLFTDDVYRKIQVVSETYPETGKKHIFIQEGIEKMKGNNTFLLVAFL